MVNKNEVYKAENTNTTKETKMTKRAVIKMLLGRSKNYRVSDYVRKVNAITGKAYSATEIKRSLYHMAHEGTLAYHVVQLTSSQSIVGLVIAA